MNFGKENREAVTSIVVFIISVGLCAYSCTIPIRNETYVQSARNFPQIISSVMALLSTLYVIAAFRRRQDLTWGRFRQCVKTFLKAESTRRIMAAIVLIGIYIFLGVQKGRFYISSLLFMIVALSLYARRVKPVVAVLAAAAFIGCCWLLFYRIFGIQLI